MTHALVVLVNDKSTVSMFVHAATCLNHVAQLATFVAPDVRVALYFGTTDAKWLGRGTR